MTLLLCVFCLTAGTWIAVYLHRREQRLSGSSAPVLGPDRSPVLSGSDRAALGDLAVGLPAPDPDRTPRHHRNSRVGRELDLDRRIRRALGAGKPRTKRSADSSLRRKDTR